MASIDYGEARKEIERIFSSEYNAHRKILFWYDPTQGFKDDILGDDLPFCRLIVCDGNEFAVKKTIEHDDPDSNILVYIPHEKPLDVNNWLLDILSYSEEYYADTVALTMRSLGLTNSALRNVIEKHYKFFDSTDRVNRLRKYVLMRDDMPVEDLKLAMMAVLTRADHYSIESILTELIFEREERSRYKDLIKYGFEQDLWEMICRQYNYSGIQELDLLTKKFLFTAMMEQKADYCESHTFYSQYLIDEVGRTDAKYFVDRLKRDKRYEELQQKIAEDLKIEGLIEAREIGWLQDVDIFRCIDKVITQKITASLLKRSMDYDVFNKVIVGRYNSCWYQQFSAQYQLLLSTIDFFKRLDKPLMVADSVVEMVKTYAQSLYKIDTDYRHICYYYRVMQEPEDEFSDLMTLIEETYQKSFLECLGNQFSEAISRIADWEFGGLNLTSGFYQSITRAPFKKMFVIVSDAMRYEIGQELNDRIKTDPVLKGSSEISFAISPIPSETRFGMASLLPHRNITYVNKMVMVDNHASNSINARNEILQAKNETYGAIGYEEIMRFSRDELRKYMVDKSLVYIFHNTIDNEGEHSESKVFEAAKSAIEEILNLVKRLYTNLQTTNFYITADHGFLYRHNAVCESQKYGGVVSLGAEETSKRYVLTNVESLSIPYTIEMPLSVENAEGYRVICPWGYDLFKTQGGGLQYIHGGMSLQEVVVPVIHISELRSAKLKDSIRPVGVRLKNVTRKITNRSFTLEFEQYEKVEDKKQAITCVAYFVDEQNQLVSGEYQFVAKSMADDEESRVTKIRFNLKNIDFDRNKRYYLVLRNAETPGEYIEREPFVIDLLNFKLF